MGFMMSLPPFTLFMKIPRPAAKYTISAEAQFYFRPGPIELAQEITGRKLRLTPENHRTGTISVYQRYEEIYPPFSPMENYKKNVQMIMEEIRETIKSAELMLM